MIGGSKLENYFIRVINKIAASNAFRQLANCWNLLEQTKNKIPYSPVDGSSSGFAHLSSGFRTSGFERPTI
jgi:hypothetical protein